MSMRMKLYFNLFVAMVAMFAITACSNEPEPNGPNNETPLCKVSVEATSITDTTLEFCITSSDADQVRYIFAQSSETAPTAETILAEGTEVEANKSVTVKFEELTPDTKYILHVAGANSKDTAYAYQEAVTEESQSSEPTIKIVVGEVGVNSAKFTITTTNATTVSYLVYDLTSADSEMPEGELPTTEEIFANGKTLEANVAAEIEVNDLQSGIEYIIVVAAEGEGDTVVEGTTFNTLFPAPVIAAALTEDIGYDYAVFRIRPEYVNELKYVCIKAGTRDVTADQVMKNGTAIETIDATEIRIEGLAEETAYEVYVAAKGLNGDVVMEALTFTTTKNIIVYTMSDSTTASAYKYTEINYYVTFNDEVNGYTLNADFYVAEGAEYLTSGEYTLGGFNAGEITAAYTSFMFTPTDLSTTTFSSGSLNVVATPNEDTREIHYDIEGTLYFDDGNSVVLNYSGLIANISLPEIQEGAPEGAYVFVVSPDTNMPKRVHGSSLQAGEYYLKFYDSNWNELTLDLFIDPTLCDNGNQALPAGIYSTADGSLDTYSNISLYNPYFAGNFTEAELQVDKDGDTYTFTLLGTVVSGSTEKLVYMKYTGEVADMVK